MGLEQGRAATVQAQKVFGALKVAALDRQLLLQLGKFIHSPLLPSHT